MAKAPKKDGVRFREGLPPPGGPPPDDRLRIGVEGKGITPESFDVVPTLEFVTAFVVAMRAAAAVDKLELEFRSLEVTPGSAAFAMVAENRPLADAMMERIRLYVVGDEEPPHGAKGAVNELRKALESLPPTHIPFIEVHRKRAKLPTTFGFAGVYVEVTNVRGLVVHAGGVNPPRIRLALDDGGTITPRTSRDLAARAGKHLYQSIDAVVTLEIEGGKVLETSELHDFTVIEDMSPADEIKRWKDWFARVGDEWESIDSDDIERELGREVLR